VHIKHKDGVKGIVNYSNHPRGYKKKIYYNTRVIKVRYVIMLGEKLYSVKKTFHCVLPFFILRF